MDIDPKLLQRALVSVVGPADQADKLELKAALDVLDAAVGEPRIKADARLHHFLKNRSYQKALDWMRSSAKA